jgi:hypothetical protein
LLVKKEKGKGKEKKKTSLKEGKYFNQKIRIHIYFTNGLDL